MSFAESVKTAFSKYATFSGRARRSEYWWWVLFQIILLIAVIVISAAVRPLAWLLYIEILATLIPSISVTVRRLHDTNHSGWWYLIGLVPIRRDRAADLHL